MKPRFYHYLGAHFIAILGQAGGVFLVSVTAIGCANLFAENTDTLSIFQGILAIAAAYGLGALLAILVFGRLIYSVVVWLAGGPFAVGDKVMILRGNRQRKIAEVYEVWKERGQVRLRLSDEECNDAADVFHDNEVIRVEPKSPPLATTPAH